MALTSVGGSITDLGTILSLGTSNSLLGRSSVPAININLFSILGCLAGLSIEQLLGLF